MRLAGRASDPHCAFRFYNLSHPPDTPVWDADAITDLEWFTHYNVLKSRFTALSRKSAVCPCISSTRLDTHLALEEPGEILGVVAANPEDAPCSE